MFTRNNNALVCSALWVAGIATQAFAGPYPIEDLRAWLSKARAEFTVVQAAIDELTSAIPPQVALVKRLEAQALVAPADPAVYSNLRLERRRLEIMYSDLAIAQSRKVELVSYIEWLMVQIAAWEEMGKTG